MQIIVMSRTMTTTMVTMRMWMYWLQISWSLERRFKMCPRICMNMLDRESETKEYAPYEINKHMNDTVFFMQKRI